MNSIQLALCKISHYSPNDSFGLKGFRMISIIQVIQFIDILLPDSSMDLMKYDENTFQIIKQIGSAFLLQIDGIQSYFLYLIIGFNLMIIMIMAHLIVMKGTLVYDFRVSIIYNYWMLLQSILYLPQLSIMFYTIIQIGDHQVYFSWLFIIIIVMQMFLSIYFMRCHRLQQLNSLTKKYSIIDVIILMLNGLLMYLHLTIGQTYTYYIKIAILGIIAFIEACNIYLNSPYGYLENRLSLQIASVKCTSVMIMAITVGTNVNYFPNSSQLIVQLIQGTLIYHLIGEIQDTRHPQSHYKQAEIGYSSTCYLIQQILYLQPKVRITQQSKYAIQYAHILSIHHQTCNNKKCQTVKLNKNNKHLIGCLLKSLLMQYDHESTHLYYADYLNSYCRRPTLSLLHFRRYELKADSFSIYYKFTTPRVYQKLTEQIELSNRKLKQEETNQIQSSIAITAAEVVQFILIEKQVIQSIHQILDRKIVLLQQQINGFESIYELKIEVLSIIRGVQQYTKQLSQLLNIDLDAPKLEYSKLDPLVLKLASLHYSVVMNNYNQSLISENQLQATLKYESALSLDLISTLAVLNNRVQVIQISLLKNLGAIQNTNNKSEILEFFSYDQDELQQLAHVNQLMPDFIAQRHNQILMNYISTGQSPLFSKFRTVFAMSKQGFIFPIQLQLFNNFEITTDYTILGFIFKTNQNADYILFDDNGCILAITQQIWKSIFADNSIAITLEQLIQHSYIFLLIPQIGKCVEQITDKKSTDYSTMQIDQEITLIVRPNLTEFLSGFISKMVQQNPKYSSQQGQSEQLLDQGYSYSNSNYSQSMKSQMSRLAQQHQNYLTDETLQIKIQEYFHEKHIKEIIQYNIRIMLTYQQFGTGQNKRTFYQMEISDFRRTDQQFNSTNASQCYHSQGSKFQSIANNLAASEMKLQTSADSNYQVQHEEEPNVENMIVSLIPQQMKDASYYIKQYGGQQQQNASRDQSQAIYNEETIKHSMSCGPRSQRATFMSLDRKLLQNEDIELLELELQLNSARNNEQKMILQDQASDDQNISKVDQQINSISVNKQNKSNQILQIMIQHKQGDIEVEGNQSRSSATSKTSGTSASETVRHFQRGSIMQSDMFGIGVINLVIIISLIIIMIVHVLQIEQYHTTIQANSKSLYGPLQFSRYFTKAAALSWTLGCQALGVIDASEYLQKKTLNELNLLSQYTFTNMTDLYPLFIDIEIKGLMDQVTISNLKYPPENSTYTKFASLLQTNAFNVFKWNTQMTGNQTSILHTDYFDSLLFLRYNIKNINIMNNQLLTSLLTLFYDNLDNQISSLLTQVILEISIIGIIVASQILIWKKIEEHNQLILLLLGKMQEIDALNQIQMYKQLKSVLQIQYGKQSWKLCDFYQVCFQNQHNHIQQQLDKQGLKGVGSKSHNEKNKGKLNQSLNARVQNSKIKLLIHAIFILVTFFIIFLYLFGGFLIYNSQQQAIYPTQKLSNQYLEFASQLDVLVVASLIIKTQPLLYQKLIDTNIYSTQFITSIKDGGRVFIVFKELLDQYSKSIMTIFKGIVLSNLISVSDQKQLYELYSSTLCNVEALKINLQFCQLDKLGQPQFVTQFGQFTEADDNTVFLSRGIVGIVSLLQTFFKENYDYEYNNSKYLSDTKILTQLLETKLFNNVVFSHFTDTFWAVILFLDTISLSITTIMQSQLTSIIAYFLTLGIFISIFYLAFYAHWLAKTQIQMRQLRLSILLLPLEILMNPQTLSTMKRLR